MPRSYDEELKFMEKVNPYCWRIKEGFVPNMKVSLNQNSKETPVCNLLAL